MVKRCTPILLLISAFAVLVGGALMIALQYKRTQDGQTLQAPIAQLPTGSMATDAERVPGPPDRVLRAKGVLVNGVMWQGAVAGFDQFWLVLERGGQVQLVYKHAISAMQPGHPLNLAGESQAEEEG